MTFPSIAMHRRAAAAAAALAVGVLAPLASAQASDSDSWPQQAARALGAGDGPAAAAAIIKGGYDHDPDTLAEIIYRGGLIAVNHHGGDPFAKAVAYAFPHAAVPVVIASETFAIAGRAAASGGLTTEEAQAGTKAIVLTYRAYLV